MCKFILVFLYLGFCLYVIIYSNLKMLYSLDSIGVFGFVNKLVVFFFIFLY